MTTRIVCAVDRSEGARHALSHAYELAGDLGMDLGLVHVAADGPYPFGNRAAVERGRFATWQATQVMFREVRELGGMNGQAPGEVLFGSPADALVRLSGEDDTAMIVVGTRGHGPLRTLVLGSTSSALAERAKCPVVIVPPPSTCAATARARGVVCGLVDDDSGAEIEYAAQLAEELGEPLTIVPVDGSSTVPSPATAIAEAARNEGARLIVVGSHGTRRLGGIRRAPLGSRLASSGAHPVVVVPAA